MSLKSSLVRRFERLFQVHAGEGRPLLLLFVLYFLVIGGIMVGRNARDSLFMQDFGRQYLPYMYLANAVFVVLCAAVYNLFIDRVNRFRFVMAANGLFAVLMLASWWVLEFYPFRLFYPVLYILVQILWILGMMQFWTLAGDVFDTRQAKRLFPVVGMGGLLGMVVSGIVVPPLVRLLGTINMLVVYALCLGLSVIAAGLIRWFMPQVPPDVPVGPAPEKLSQWQEFKAGLDYVRGSALLLTLGGLVLALNVVFNVVDFQFNVVMATSFTTRDDLTSYLASFRGLAGFMALLFQLFLTSRVLNRAGVGRAILIHPGFLALATAAMFIDFGLGLPGWHGLATGFISANAAKFGDHVLLYTIQDSAYNLLFNPIPAERRGRARGFIDGYLKPLGSGLAGLLLIIYLFIPNPAYLSGAAFVIACVWLVLALRIRRCYTQSLMDNLASSDQLVRSAALTALGGLKHESDLALLLRVARSDDEALACYAIQTLARQERPEAIPTIVELVRHPSALIRDAAVDALSRLDGEHHVRLFTELLQDPDEDVRAEAIEALGRAGELQDIRLLLPFLSDDSAKIRAKTVVTLIRAGGIDGVLGAAEALKRMLDSPAPGERVIAAKALGALHIKHFASSLLALLQDPERQVRQAAIRALGKIHDPRATGPLVELLPDRYLGKQAQTALVLIGRKSEGEIVGALRQSRGNLQQALGLLEVLEMLPYRGTLPPLVPFLQAEHARLRTAALRVLQARTLSGREREQMRGTISAALHVEMKDLYWITLDQITIKQLPHDDPVDLLLEALAQQRSRILAGLFLGLGLLDEQDSLDHIHNQLLGGDARGRALAFEALETVLQGLQIDLPLLPMLEDLEDDERARQCRKVLQTDNLTPLQCLQRLIHHPYNWIRACAVYCLSYHAAGVELQTFVELVQDRDHLVRENAVVGMAAVGGAAGRERVQALLASPDQEVRRTAQIVLDWVK